VATYTVTNKMRQDDVAVLQTLTPHDLDVGDLINVAGVGGGFDGSSLLVRAIPEYLFTGVDGQGDYTYAVGVPIPNQVLFQDVGDDVARVAAVGTIVYSVTVTWIDDQDVLDWLGIDPATLNDELFVTVCTDAANEVAYRRRSAAGYTDSVSTCGSDVKLGTTMYAAALYRERGSLDSFQSFDVMQTPAPTGAMGQILRLWGCNRAQVA
jgi:hypothetical protein